MIKQIIETAEATASDTSIDLIDRITRLRAAISFGEEVGLDVSHLKELETNATQAFNGSVRT